MTTEESLFGHVLVGVDGTGPGFEACRQAARLAVPEAVIEAVAVVHVAEAARAGANAPRIADELQRDADRALAEALRLIGPRARPTFVDGLVTASLLREIELTGATVVVLGTHGHRRMTEILIGGVAGEMLHRAPCSVLVARASRSAGLFPRSIAVGIDGSSEAEAALVAAEELAARFAVPLHVVVATRAKDLDLERARAGSPAAEEVDAHPLDALVDASRHADLLVVGNRGLHGVKALGSVSERAAHHAACSVLVVRRGRAG